MSMKYELEFHDDMTDVLCSGQMNAAIARNVFV